MFVKFECKVLNPSGCCPKQLIPVFPVDIYKKKPFDIVLTSCPHPTSFPARALRMIAGCAYEGMLGNSILKQGVKGVILCKFPPATIEKLTIYVPNINTLSSNST